MISEEVNPHFVVITEPVDFSPSFLRFSGFFGLEGIITISFSSFVPVFTTPVLTAHVLVRVVLVTFLPSGFFSS
ncbi:hypothetical protein IJS64_03040 [bacterium]|nr:hypothetical protein [bacterium]